MGKPDPNETSMVHLPPARSRRLFFEKWDIPQIRANTRLPQLAPIYEEWRATSFEGLKQGWADFEASGDVLKGFPKFWQPFSKLGLVQLVEPSREKAALLLEMMERVTELRMWDYLYDGDAPMGIMRASQATCLLLFVREVLEGELAEDFDRALLQAIGDKGAEPCYQAVWGCDHPDEVQGWVNDPELNPTGTPDMSRWPVIFSSNNLRAIPTMGLGLGALACRGIDPRAETWLQKAETSSLAVFELFLGDGSYFEGMSYSNYTLSSLLSFCGAHQRQIGTIDWTKAMNWDGYVENVMAMQAGRYPDGSPDIVNFSDAKTSIYACIPSWVERYTGNPHAQWVANHCSMWGHFQDFLWYRPERPEAAPPVSLKTYHSDLDWVVCRSGWRPEDGVVAFRSGYPANHEHADRNHFFFKIYGERLLTDLLGAAYFRNDPKWSLRLTGGHNAVLVGGEGHQYHDGEEGTNESQSEARIIRFEDRGNVVWWSSDATSAYRLVNPAIEEVTRTMLYAKPDILMVLDKVRLREADTVEIRFFPFASDGEATLTHSEGDFSISRPGATLFGAVAGNGGPEVGSGKLEPMPPNPDFMPEAPKPSTPQEFGDYPFVRVLQRSANDHCLLTVLQARPGVDASRPAFLIREREDGFFCKVADFQCQIVPEAMGARLLL